VGDRRATRALATELKPRGERSASPPISIQAQVDAGDREGLTTEEREELRRLRRENRTLRMERAEDASALLREFFAARRGGADL